MARRKILDPIHSFIRYNNGEKKVLASWPMQRLHYIHQNSLAYLVYPGATHSRFEHSLGVMELAGMAFDTIAAEENRHERCRGVFPTDRELDYWRQVLRLAALSHDMGHLPFSHAAEEGILPPGTNHETYTMEIIRSDEMREIWKQVDDRIEPEHIVKLAVGEKDLDLPFTPWERILSEIITGDVFGVDRMDYLLRDSHYTGVPSGRFDHYRLIDMLRVLPKNRHSDEITLGIDEGGLRSAEDLLLSRYFMFKQVYYHDVCRVYSIHLTKFLKLWKADNPALQKVICRMTDNEVLAELFKASRDSGHPGHVPAKNIIGREHYKLLFQPTPETSQRGLTGNVIFNLAVEAFGSDAVLHDLGDKTGKVPYFTVLTRTNGLESSEKLSSIFSTIPPVEAEYVFIRREECREARRWLQEILDNRAEGVHHSVGNNLNR